MVDRKHGSGHLNHQPRQWIYEAASSTEKYMLVSVVININSSVVAVSSDGGFLINSNNCIFNINSIGVIDIKKA